VDTVVLPPPPVVSGAVIALSAQAIGVPPADPSALDCGDIISEAIKAAEITTRQVMRRRETLESAGFFCTTRHPVSGVKVMPDDKTTHVPGVVQPSLERKHLTNNALAGGRKVGGGANHRRTCHFVAEFR